MKEKCLIITGRPGSGKSTLIQKIVSRLKIMGIGLSGVITPEIRREKERIGFMVKGINTGAEEILATKEEKIPFSERTCRLGKYIVFPYNFEKVLFMELEKECEIIVVDEIGPMELGCSKKLKSPWLEKLKNQEKCDLMISVKKDLVEDVKKFFEEKFWVYIHDIDKEGSDRAYIFSLEILTGTEAFLFDLDGVIVDSSEFHKKSWFEVMRKLGVNFGEEDFKSTFGMTNDIIIRKYVPNASDDEVRKIGEEKERIYRELAKGKIKPIPGSIEFIKFLKEKGIKLALVSSTPKENIEFLSDEIGMRNLFDVVISGSDIRRGKPNPDCYITAAEKLGVPTKKCWVIEDSQHGIDAGSSAGAKTIGILTTHKNLQKTDITVKNFEELKKIFLELIHNKLENNNRLLKNSIHT
jgi:beta-phosphoglucomutase